MLKMNPAPCVNFKKRYAATFSVPTVFAKLNKELYGGLRGGETAYVLADSGRGKSTLLDNIALNAGLHFYANHPERWAYLFLLEMDVASRSERIIQSQVRAKKGDLINRGTVTPQPSNLIIVDDTDFDNSINGVVKFLEEREEKPGLIVIDYVDNMDEVMGADWRFHKKMSKQLEKLAKRFNSPVWTGSQVTKPMEFNAENELLDERHFQGGKAKKDSATLCLSINHRGNNLVTLNPFKNRRGSTEPFNAYVDFDMFLIEDLKEE